MKNKPALFFTFAVMALTLICCSAPGELKMEYKVTGVETNCYLLYDTKSKEAALFDVGGPIDTLLNLIVDNNLRLRYFFCTHGHPDHILGLPDIRENFPGANVVIHKLDNDNMPIMPEWANGYFGVETIEAWRHDPVMSLIVEFNPQTFGQPDILVEDGQVFTLGEFDIIALHSPGHSPGSVCYYVGNFLFSGDVLFHSRVGRTDLLHGSAEDQVTSVRRLYTSLPNETIVYPGHGEFTDIGSEKNENREITMDKADLEN